MKPGAWARAREYIAELLQLLSSDSSLILTETASEAAVESEDGSVRSRARYPPSSATADLVFFHSCPLLPRLPSA